jgi:hypothetical protein
MADNIEIDLFKLGKKVVNGAIAVATLAQEMLFLDDEPVDAILHSIIEEPEEDNEYTSLDNPDETL